MQVITTAIIKGGSGKTATALSIAQAARHLEIGRASCRERV